MSIAHRRGARRSLSARARAGAAALALVALLAGCAGDRPESTAAESLPVTDLLGSRDAEGYAQALEIRAFDFPRDHGPHPGFRSEWWYVTGHLEDPAGRRFGYQLTFFRQALTPLPVARGSAWAADQVYMGHLAVTDVEGRRFRAFERLARGAAGLAGARAGEEPGDPAGGALRVWLEDWRLEAPAGGAPPFTLAAAADGWAIELELAPGKPLVLQGDRGLSRKGERPGNASYYYAFTRLPTRGTLSVAGETFEVAGASWMDREWSTSALEDGQTGWDWFSVQLDDGSDLMLYRMRRADGGDDPNSSGSLVDAAGAVRALRSGEFTIEVLERWRSPRTGAVYPARWRLAIPSEELGLEIEPLLPDQELDLSVRYWEGAVAAAGRRGGEPLRGRGYVELTGY